MRVEAFANSLREQQSGSLLVVTGAGISLASGIATFRGTDPGAIWKQDVTELGTLRFFLEDPVGSWRWYLNRFDGVLSSAPNPAHFALVKLEHWFRTRGNFLVVTQNVDTLHEQAGQQALVKIHGSADRVRCVQDGCTFGAPNGSIPRSEFSMDTFRDQPCRSRLPTCPECGSLIRQHILWFDEYYHSHADYQFQRVEAFANEMNVVLFIGTSLSVGVTEMILHAARARNAQIFVVDPNELPRSLPGNITHLRHPAEHVLPELLRELETAG